MDVSFLLIAELGKKMNISFFMHSLCGGVLGDVSLPLKTISVFHDSESVLLYRKQSQRSFASPDCVLKLSGLLW